MTCVLFYAAFTRYYGKHFVVMFAVDALKHELPQRRLQLLPTVLAVCEYTLTLLAFWQEAIQSAPSLLLRAVLELVASTMVPSVTQADVPIAKAFPTLSSLLTAFSQPNELPSEFVRVFCRLSGKNSQEQEQEVKAMLRPLSSPDVVLCREEMMRQAYVPNYPLVFQQVETNLGEFKCQLGQHIPELSPCLNLAKKVALAGDMGTPQVLSCEELERKLKQQQGKLAPSGLRPGRRPGA